METRQNKLEERVRELEQWRAEHSIWDDQRHSSEGTILQDHGDTLEGLEARVRILELWKAETSGAAPLKEAAATNLVVDIEEAKRALHGVQKKISTLQVRMFIFMGAVTGVAVFLAKIFGDVVGGLLLKRLLGISSVPPTIP